MATIEKRGSSYRIRASSGYTVGGRQVRPSMTWTPDPGMTPRQIEKALARQAVLFDEKVQKGEVQDNRIKFAEFAAKYMEDFGALHLKPRPYKTYTENLVKINAALGHIRLCDLRTAHINAFYKNLQEEGVREKVAAVCRLDLAAWMKQHRQTVASVSRQSSLSRPTIRAAMDGEHVSRGSAEKITAVLGVKPGQAFRFEKDMTPLAPATVLSYHRTLSAILTKAVKWGYLQINPADAAEKPSPGRHEAPYLEEADARRLVELLQEEPIRWRAILTFDLLSGLRRAEVLGLRWCDVDFGNSTITVRQTSNYLPGRGVYVGTPKTHTSERPLRLSRAAMAMLLEYKHWQDVQRELLGDAWEDVDDRVFTTESGAPVFPDSVTQWFTKFVKRSGLPRVTVHSLRHTYATLMIADGVPLVVVSQQMGHAQASTTANIYAHAIASAQARAAQTFDRFNDLVVGSAAPEERKKAAGG